MEEGPVSDLYIFQGSNGARGQNVPIVFALAGGYTWSGLTLKEVAELHLETVRAFNI